MSATVTKIKEPSKRPWQKVTHNFEDIKKVKKKLGRVAVEELEALDEDQLRGYLVALANHHEATTVAKEEDPDIERLKKEMKAARDKYKETLDACKQRRMLVVHLLDKMLS